MRIFRVNRRINLVYLTSCNGHLIAASAFGHCGSERLSRACSGPVNGPGANCQNAILKTFGDFALSVAR